MGMAERTTNWLINTCLLALIPVISRLLVWSISSKSIEAFAVSDLVAFGLVLHSANINEVNRLENTEPSWKTIHNGMSIIFLVMYALLLFASIDAPENINLSALLKATFLLGAISVLLSCSIFMRTKVSPEQP